MVDKILGRDHTNESNPTISMTITVDNGTTNVDVSLSDLMKIINGLTEDASPDVAADFLVSFDTSASGPKKVKPNSFGLGAAFAGSGVQGFQMVQAADTDHDVTFGAGFATDSTYAYALRTTASMTKQIDAAWAVGDAAGGLDTGAVGNNTFYYHWVIRKDSDGSIDHLWSASTSSPTMPAGYTYKRMTGWSVRTNGSANIIAFIHVGNRIYYKSPPGLEVDTTALSTTRTDSTRSYLPAQRVVAMCNVYALRASANVQVYFSNPDLTDLATSVSATPLSSHGHNNNFAVLDQVDILTDASGVFSFVAAGSSTTLRVAPLGWIVP
jgi:hypothetical protein